MNHLDIFKPSYLIELCKRYNLSPSKKYGQNYLVTKVYIDKMLEAGDIKKDDFVVEIGPGFGVLTFALVEKAKKVVSFEIEQKLKEYWEENKTSNLVIIWGNFLYKWDEFSKSIKSPYKLVANLPYQITSNVLRIVLDCPNRPEKIVVMVQKEVAWRIIAKKGEMSILAVAIQYYGNPKVISKVTKGNFWPSPKVDSAILLIDNIISPKNQFSDEEFFSIVRAGFANKRKQLWRNLSQALNLDSKKVKDILVEVCGNDKIRAEELGVEDWVRVVEKLK